MGAGCWRRSSRKHTSPRGLALRAAAAQPGSETALVLLGRRRRRGSKLQHPKLLSCTPLLAWCSSRLPLLLPLLGFGIVGLPLQILLLLLHQLVVLAPAGMGHMGGCIRYEPQLAPPCLAEGRQRT